MIDTTPTPPRPPAALIEKAAQEIPRILADVPPGRDRTVELVAADLARRLQDAKHPLAAAQWAIHEAVQADRLRTGLVEVGSPSVGVPNPGWSGPAIQWHGGGRGTKVIPKGKPAPFDCFKVVATDSLWTWWHSLEGTVSGGLETVGETAAEAAYDPCDREPRTFEELASWLAFGAAFSNPRANFRRPPVRAVNNDHLFLECFTRDTFGEWSVVGLGKLRDRYIAQTGRHPDTMGAMTLRELADHFRPKTGISTQRNPPDGATAERNEPAEPGGDSPVADGPFEPNGLRFQGEEVDFGRATRQRDLAYALWDRQKGRPEEARLIEDVMTEVYGADHQTSDATFRQLCVDTNNKFATNQVPLTVKSQGGKVWLQTGAE